jgi:hypothetical protein
MNIDAAVDICDARFPVRSCATSLCAKASRCNVDMTATYGPVCVYTSFSERPATASVCVGRVGRWVLNNKRSRRCHVIRSSIIEVDV